MFTNRGSPCKPRSHVRDHPTTSPFADISSYHINSRNFMIFLLCMLDLENRDRTKFQFNWSSNFRDIRFLN